MMLSPATRAHYTAAVLRVTDDLEEWTFAHKTQNRYPERPWPNPVVYMIRKYGVLETSLGLKRPEESVGSALESLSSVCRSLTSRLRLPTRSSSRTTPRI